MDKEHAMYKEDGSDDPEFGDWKQLQTMSWMLAVPSGKLGYELYKGEMLKERERALKRLLEQNGEKALFDDLDDQ
jgi:hypothetical protein